ncbi:MAG TPA: diguanylate cyclase [bacterium]|nr:diguanylate cyclase [bacterium]HPS29553.1 diguanylate cyclase [bacterium]
MFTNWIENFGAAITVMDLEGNILDMNEASAKVNEKQGGKSLIGSNLMGCHQQRSRDIMKDLMENDTKNVYTIEKNGRKKLIYQAPWYKDGKVAGLVEISMFIPEEMPHYKR